MGDLFTDPIQLMGLGFVILTFVTQFLLGIKLYHNYTENKSRTMLAFSLTFISWGFGLMFLTIERVALNLIETNSVFEPVGIFFGYSALTASVLGILILDIFASHVTFPKHMKKLMVIPLILAIAFLIIFFTGGELTAPPPDYEVILPPIVRTSMLYLLFPLFIYPVAVLAYYTFTMVSKSPPHAKRSALVTIAVVLVILVYFTEVIGPHEIINYLRVLYVAAIVLFFISFTRFIELNWPEKIRHLYLTLAEKGLCLYNHSFAGKGRMESNLVTGFITGLISLVQEITQTEKQLKVVDVEDIKIILEHGNKNVVGILMAEANYKILRNKLHDLVERFETEFATELSKFTGSVTEFKRTKELIDEIFAYEDIFS